MTNPTHRVTKVLSAGDFDHKVGDLVDASNWANVSSLISTDYLVPLSQEEIAALTPVVETPVEAVEEAPVVAKKAPAKKPATKK